VRIEFCGVRGSAPAPGPEFVRYGGNTSCVAIGPDGEDPTLLLDAGSGLSRLGALLGGRPFRGTLLLGHLHWDHTHGLPFAPAVDRDDAAVRLLLPAQAGGSAEQLLARAMSPPSFPITPDQLRGRWSFGCLEAGRHELESFAVLAREIPHKGGRTFGYRVDDGLAYLSDHSPTSLGPGPDGLGARHDAALELADGVDVLVHDAQYTPAEFADRRDFGHSSIDYAVALAVEAGARSLVLFHHDPRRTDDELDALACGLRDAPLPVTVAREGDRLTLPGPPTP
jgi:phosphoribosyl 1,2-cyclic phosphodiesterase